MELQTRERLHTVKSAATFLGGVSVSTVRKWAQQGKLTRVRVGGRLVRIRESELVSLIKPEPRSEMPAANAPDFTVAVLAHTDQLLLVEVGADGYEKVIDAAAKGYEFCGYMGVADGVPTVACEPGIYAAAAMAHAGPYFAQMYGPRLQAYQLATQNAKD
jgi:excisionase family DNA binding protein